MAAMGNEYTPNQTLRPLRAEAMSVLSTVEPQCLAQCLVHKWSKMNFCRVKVTKPEQVRRKQEGRARTEEIRSVPWRNPAARE